MKGAAIYKPRKRNTGLDSTAFSSAVLSSFAVWTIVVPGSGAFDFALRIRDGRIPAVAFYTWDTEIGLATLRDDLTVSWHGVFLCPHRFETEASWQHENTTLLEDLEPAPDRESSNTTFKLMCTKKTQCIYNYVYCVLPFNTDTFKKR